MELRGKILWNLVGLKSLIRNIILGKAVHIFGKEKYRTMKGNMWTRRINDGDSIFKDYWSKISTSLLGGIQMLVK